jgi:Uri superfamily endonuclease
MKMVKTYTLSHPITNEVRYVGKTVESLNERLRKHLQRKDKT